MDLHRSLVFPAKTAPRSTVSVIASEPASAHGPQGHGAQPARRLGGGFGPLTGLRVAVLVVAMSFLAAAVGWAISERGQDPLSGTDVGFLQDMGYHHEQGVQLSLLLLAKDGVDDGLQAYAQEIVLGQRYEQGLFNAILDRFGHASTPGDEAMGWMGPPMPPDRMDGLATEDQIDQLREAEGTDAESLWIALMTEHHLGGLHMADWEARHGNDTTSRNIARAMVAAQRGEVIDLDRYRASNDLPLPDGFSDPRQDQRLNPLSLSAAAGD
jgi:uncharacterized protein (DUF305 family)